MRYETPEIVMISEEEYREMMSKEYTAVSHYTSHSWNAN